MESIYLDHAATTPVRREVREEMLPYLSEHFGNTSSAHRWGRRAASALEEATGGIVNIWNASLSTQNERPLSI